MSVESGQHWIHEIYASLVRLGVDPRDWQVNFTIPGAGAPSAEGQEPPPAANTMLALPSTKVALSTDGDDTALLSEEGWHVERIALADLRVASAVLSQITQASREHVRRASTAAMFKTGSKEEARLLAGLLAANIREPDRNHVIYRDEHREGGRELTTPDFAWPDLKVAFFVDGLYWHVNKDDDAALKALRKTASDPAARKALKAERASRAERDADNRSQMVLRGWRVLSCTDRDLSTDAGVARQVERIVEMLRVVSAQHTPPLAVEPPRRREVEPVSQSAVDLLLEPDPEPDAEPERPVRQTKPSSTPPWEDEEPTEEEVFEVVEEDDFEESNADEDASGQRTTDPEPEPSRPRSRDESLNVSQAMLDLLG